jgi:type II secretory pathway component GspD/PulD (secretin)
MGLKRILITFLVLAAITVSDAFAQGKRSVLKKEIDELEDVVVSDQLEELFSKNNGKVSAGKNIIIDVIDFKDVDIMRALKEIEQKTGFIIIPEQNIDGSISMNFHNIEVWDVLRIILQPKGFAYYEKEGVIEVMSVNNFLMEYGYEFGDQIDTRIIPVEHLDLEEWIAKLDALKSEKGKIFSDSHSEILILLDSQDNLEKMEKFIKKVDVPVQTKAFYLRYSRAHNLEGKIKSLISEDIGNVKINKASNMIVVTDSYDKIEEISKFIDAADRKKEVSVEAGVFQIRLNQEHSDGVDWEAIVSDYQGLDLFAKDDNVFPRRKQLSIGTVTNEDYEVLLDALDTVGEMKALLSFKTTAIVNLEKKINLDTGAPFKGIRAASDMSDFEKNKFEIQMDLVPKIEEDGIVVMRLSPQLYWSFGKALSAKKSESEQYLSKLPMDVRVGGNETIVIGGLVNQKKIARTAKFPLLGDLPLVGFVFRHKSQLVERVEYVIFLTPKILEDESAP